MRNSAYAYEGRPRTILSFVDVALRVPCTWQAMWVQTQRKCATAQARNIVTALPRYPFPHMWAAWVARAITAKPNDIAQRFDVRTVTLCDTSWSRHRHEETHRPSRPTAANRCPCAPQHRDPMRLANKDKRQCAAPCQGKEVKTSKHTMSTMLGHARTASPDEGTDYTHTQCSENATPSRRAVKMQKKPKVV